MEENANINDVNENEKPNKNKKIILIEAIIIIILILLLLSLGIPVLIRYLNNAKLKTDTLLVKNLNLAIERSNEKHETMQDALDCVEKAGYILERINVSSDENEILWDSENDLFCYFDAKKNSVVYIPEFKPDKYPTDVAYFKIYQNNEAVPAEDGTIDFCADKSRFSAYLVQNDLISYVKTDKGFDAGKNQCIISVTYENQSKQNVIIRTNGGSLIINGPEDTVRHYGKADSVELINIANKSYHEFGLVTFLSILQGHVVLENNSEIKAIHFVKSGIKDEKGADTFYEIIITIEGDIELPEFSRDAVVINEDEGTKVCIVNFTDETQHIYLFQQGIYQQIKVAHVDYANVLVWIDNSDASESTQIVAEEIANNYTGKVEWKNNNEEERVLNIQENEKVEEKGTSATEREKEVNASVKVKATIKGIEDTPTVYNLFDLRGYFPDYEKGVLEMHTSTSKLDKAFSFSGLSESDYDALNVFIAAKDENGNKIFKEVKDFTIENIQIAFNYMLANNQDDAVSKMRVILADKIEYLDWKVDWEVSFDRPVDAGTVVLAGAYNEWKDNTWTGFDLPYQLNEGQSVKLMKTGMSIFNNKDGEWSQNYLQILTYVRIFKCGFANMSNANVGTNITVKLCIYSPDGAQRIECGSYTYTLGEVSADNLGYIGK